jgi:hypothetical protein
MHDQGKLNPRPRLCYHVRRHLLCQSNHKTQVIWKRRGDLLCYSPTGSMRFGPYKKFSVKACYYAMNFGGVTVLGNTDIWNSLTPKKCKIFASLALHNRINTRERLNRKGIISDSTCPFGCQTDENLTHLLFSCPHSSMI